MPPFVHINISIKYIHVAFQNRLLLWNLRRPRKSCCLVEAELQITSNNSSTCTNLAVEGLISYVRLLHYSLLILWGGMYRNVDWCVVCNSMWQPGAIRGWVLDIILYHTQPPSLLPLILAQSFVSVKSNTTMSCYSEWKTECVCVWLQGCCSVTHVALS